MYIKIFIPAVRWINMSEAIWKKRKNLVFHDLFGFPGILGAPPEGGQGACYRIVCISHNIYSVRNALEAMCFF